MWIHDDDLYDSYDGDDNSYNNNDDDDDKYDSIENEKVIMMIQRMRWW